MRREDKLKKEARADCEWRGHTMYNFDRGVFYKDVHHTSCKDCGAEVFVDEHPPPNGINIAGEAVAVNCTKGV